MEVKKVSFAHRYNRRMTTHAVGDDSDQITLTPKRLDGLQDGVFAIVMTLIVLEMRLPEAASGAELRHHLAEMLPLIITYIVTFMNLGIYWVGQVLQMHSIERSDRAFLWIQIIFLLFISVLPFSSSLLGRYPDEQISAIVYGVNMIGVGLSSFWGWCYASHHHRLTTHALTPSFIRSVKRRILVAPVAAVIAIALSFFTMRLSILCYLLVLPYYIIPGKIDRVWRQKAVPHDH